MTKPKERPARSFFWGLRGQLTRSFGLVILLAVGVVIGVVLLLGPLRLEALLQLAGQRRAATLAPFLADYYQRTGSWQGLEQLLAAAGQPVRLDPNQVVTPILPWQINLRQVAARDRLVLVDAGQRVVVDSADLLAAGQPLDPVWQGWVVPLAEAGGPEYGLVLLSDLDQVAGQLVRRALSGTLLLTGFLAVALAALVSLGLTQRLVRPLHELGRAAQRLATGEPPAVVPAQRVDEVGELTHAFNEMAGALQRQKQLRQQLVADIAHELRTPLSVIKLEVEGLADGLQPPATAAKALHSEIAALEQLIEDLRLLSLAEAGGLTLYLDETALVPLLAEIAASWHKQAGQQQIELRLAMPDSLPPVLADSRRLSQVFHNLLGNALRYTPPEGTIILGGRLEGKEVWLWVADSGPGLPPEVLPHLFERFYRADPSRSRESGGSGLGLAIARQLVRLHGGRIWAENAPGAVFYVALPVA